MNHLLVATALALIPATASLADKAAAEAAKKAKEEAKQKAIEAAREKAKEELAKKAAANAAAAAKKADAKADAGEAKKAEEELHQKHLGIIERLTQIATATSNAELAAKVATITAKEDKRHTLAIGG
ncbi:MAG: hypothetical protein Q8O67_22175 [Deltaproteobacteria bacterium]|nr:hypothetical protein [Deltaproteobacteria bacterium]